MALVPTIHYPPSVRFLGREVFFGPVVVALSALRATVSPMRLSRLREVVGVSLRTLKRWASRWQSDLASSRFWRAARRRTIVYLLFHNPPGT
jgi:hypothetical protein